MAETLLSKYQKLYAAGASPAKATTTIVKEEKAAPTTKTVSVKSSTKTTSQASSVSVSSSQSGSEFVGPPKPVTTQPNEPVTVSPAPIATFTQETGKPLWKAFPTETPSIPESKVKEYYQKQYTIFPVIPGPIREQVTVPSEVEKAGATREYQRAAYEQYLGVKGGGEKELEHKLLSSEWYAKTQPIWKVEGKKEPVTFGELKEQEPALYLKRSSKGLWIPEIDVVRWRKEEEERIGVGPSVALGVSEVPLRMFDFDYYFSEEKEKYRAERLYETMKGVKAGKVLESWVGVQVPAYTEFIIPATTGYGLGKIFTGVKLAGGVKQASRLLKVGYGAGVVGMGAGIGATGYQVISGGFGAKELAKLSFQGLVGGVSFYGGRASALTSFKAKYPNIEWRYPGAEPVTGKQYVKFKEMTISGEGEPVYESGMYQYSQMFKPSGKPEFYINFPEMQPSRGGIDIGFIKEPGVQKVFGVVDVAGKPYTTVFGERAWSMKGFLGTAKKEYIPGSFENVDVFYRTGGVNVIKQGIYRNIIEDVEATQSVLLGGLRTIEPVSVAGFVKPSIGYVPSGLGMGLITPGFEQEIETEIKYEPEIELEPDMQIKPFVTPSFKYEPSIKSKPVTIPYIVQQPHTRTRYDLQPVEITAPGFESETEQGITQIQEPVPVQIPATEVIQKPRLKPPEITPTTTVPPNIFLPKMPLHGRGMQGWGYNRGLAFKYSFRKAKIGLPFDTGIGKKLVEKIKKVKIKT
jgi:hypothetical protein